MDHYPTYLIHYGTPGQKWGQRNYQNPDGTWTEEGLRRRRKFFNVEKGEQVIKKYGRGTGDYRVARGKVLGSRIRKGLGASIAGAVAYSAIGAAVASLNLPAAVAVTASLVGFAALYGGQAYDIVQTVKAVGDVASVNMYDKVKRRENPNYNDKVLINTNQVNLAKRRK